MKDILALMLLPLAACLAIGGLHSYLGLHVVRRGVIFLDLSLAQIATLGAGVAMVLGLDMHGGTTYLLSLAFAFGGALLFAVTRTDERRVPQEAVIGIVWAISYAAVFLVLSRHPDGAEDLKNFMAGDMLAITGRDVARLFGVYAALGLVHWVARRQLIAISVDHAGAVSRGMRVKAWDFLFYLTFAVMVTTSVGMVGVLPVFAFLIVPAVIASLFATSFGAELAIAWVASVAVSVLGMVLSYKLDLPTAATVVCTFGAVLVLAALARRLRPQRA
ncbi:MAG TPA: iron chelate uptake ABC transporter family permease subunit [Candidatus Saccharimonadales bacterium]|nr:iron chelate uptake ABC transporter family permease subunit [Candidatus Saccharimonadales bacterium]